MCGDVWGVGGGLRQRGSIAKGREQERAAARRRRKAEGKSKKVKGGNTPVALNTHGRYCIFLFHTGYFSGPLKNVMCALCVCEKRTL